MRCRKLVDIILETGLRVADLPTTELDHMCLCRNLPNFRRKLEVLFELIDYWLIFEAEVDSEDGDV